MFVELLIFVEVFGVEVFLGWVVMISEWYFFEEL